ncbi:hypothetical protein JY412_02450 [Stenotrophomonas maltophilia]|uniref:hypothetical protein n=1 Tax=Stenotrophomonas maltophilia TaxID=40324 RepID=UPI001D98E1B9|nr:hypothetical protein [Stenotrophomonas maltophilia]
MDKKPDFIICAPEPCAYQRRDAFPLDTGGFSHWHEISRDFYMELERLQSSAPSAVHGIELRKLYAADELKPVKVAEVATNGAGQTYVDWLGKSVIDYQGRALYALSGKGDE